MILGKSMLESFSFRPWALDLLPFKCSYVMADCSFSLALCTENKCFSTIYYVLLGYRTYIHKSMVKKKPERHPMIIKLLLSLWLLYKNYINYYYTPQYVGNQHIKTSCYNHLHCLSKLPFAALGICNGYWIIRYYVFKLPIY